MNLLVYLSLSYFKNIRSTNILFLQLGEAARLKPLEVELKRLEDLSEAIVQDFAYMRQREEEMRDTNGNFKI